MRTYLFCSATRVISDYQLQSTESFPGCRRRVVQYDKKLIVSWRLSTVGNAPKVSVWDKHMLLPVVCGRLVFLERCKT
jgi:hypothetical protein